MRILPEKVKTNVFAVVHKTKRRTQVYGSTGREAEYCDLQLCQILTDFNNFCTAETRNLILPIRYFGHPIPPKLPLPIRGS